MRSSWSHYLFLILLSHHSQQSVALPAVALMSPNQNLSSVPNNATNATSTALTLWPPLPYTIDLYAGGIGTLTFSSDVDSRGSPAQLAAAQRMASWLSRLLTTWKRNAAIRFLGVYVPAVQGAADANAVQLDFVYAPASPPGQTPTTDLASVVREFFDAEARFGCRALEGLFTITEPAPVRGLGKLDLSLGWDDGDDADVMRILPAGTGSAAGKPVIFLIGSPAMPEGVMEVVGVGARFPSAAVRLRVYFLLAVVINLLELEFPSKLIADFRRYDPETGLRVSYEYERLVAVPRLDGEEVAAALRTYRDLVVKRLGGCSVEFNVWKGSLVYGRLAIVLETEAGNGTVLDGTLINGTFVESSPILQLGNGTQNGGAQLATT